MFKLFQRLSLIYILIFLLLVVLIAHIFRPDIVNVDRYTIILFAILFIISILPSLQSGKISYFFEFKRDLEKAKKSVEKLKETAEVSKEAVAKVAAKAKAKTAGSNAAFTCGYLRHQIFSGLNKINLQLDKAKQLNTKDPDKLLEHLNKQGKLDKKMYQAAKDVLNLCHPDKPFEEMDDKDTEEITKTSLPLLQYLEK